MRGVDYHSGIGSCRAGGRAGWEAWGVGFMAGIWADAGWVEAAEGADNISLQACGRADIRIGFAAGLGFGSPSGFLNQASSSLPQPSSVGGTVCPLHPGLSAGQPIRIWK